MKCKDYTAFKKWYDEEARQQKKRWIFEKEYCVNDCRILREACQRFCTSMAALSGGYNPLGHSVSLPSFANTVFRARFMPADSIQFFTYRDLHPHRSYPFESLEWLHYVAKSEKKSIRHGRNHPEGEKQIGRFFVDGFDEVNNEVFEYHGCYFHGCPACYTKDAKTYGGQSMAQLFHSTMHKQKYLESRGLVYRSIWSYQWLQYKRQHQQAFQQALGDFSHVPPMNIRDALFGGRTEAFRLLAMPDSSKGEYISYLDKNCLYPAVCKQKCYPLGIPEKILWHFKPIDEYFGIAHVRVLPPASLPLPVLLQRINHKCVFTLCWRCAEQNNQEAVCWHTDEQRCFNGVYMIPELALALSMGYTLIKVHEIWHYARQGDLYSHYISTFMTEKAAASGYPANCVSDEDKRNYLQLLYDRDGVVVDPGRVENNLTKRLLSKLMLNTFWGRLAIKENKSRFEYVKDTKRFNDLFYSGNTMSPMWIL
ncbi:uncharacterized protein LOC129596780 [Paramacrobiotus metropolitanus]|uniref:uncharacterized protein LOC129596780 n=1 Tax=Paramacrobiotus metropolitanus TaxID=2943436 RepID=UPI002445AD35|nr:uncharacterized protein LOC129596780 [Paramacrobiotus metropolitanus]